KMMPERARNDLAGDRNADAVHSFLESILAKGTRTERQRRPVPLLQSVDVEARSFPLQHPSVLHRKYGAPAAALVVDLLPDLGVVGEPLARHEVARDERVPLVAVIRELADVDQSVPCGIPRGAQRPRHDETADAPPRPYQDDKAEQQGKLTELKYAEAGH